MKWIINKIKTQHNFIIEFLINNNNTINHTPRIKTKETKHIRYIIEE